MMMGTTFPVYNETIWGDLPTTVKSKRSRTYTKGAHLAKLAQKRRLRNKMAKRSRRLQRKHK